MEESIKIEQRLWEFIDGDCSAKDELEIKQLINTNEAWLIKYNELMGIDVLLKDCDIEMPSLRFTKNVMEKIAQHYVAPATKTYINKNIIRGLTIFFLVMISGLMIYLFGQAHWAGSYTGSRIPGFKLDIDKMHLDKIASHFSTNIFIGINLILGLFLMDKYLGQKKKNKHEGRWSKGDTA